MAGAGHGHPTAPAGISPQGTGSGLDADTVDGTEAANLGGTDIVSFYRELIGGADTGGVFTTFATYDATNAYCLRATAMLVSSTANDCRVLATYNDATTAVLASRNISATSAPGTTTAVNPRPAATHTSAPTDEGKLIDTIELQYAETQAGQDFAGHVVLIEGVSHTDA